MARVDVQPMSGLDAEGFAASLKRMYGAWRGVLDGEEGIHRLVQRSPLDPKQTRLTSFVRVSVDGRTSEDVVRSYVTFPYRLVKDYRTGRETEDVARVLGGNLTPLREPI